MKDQYLYHLKNKKKEQQLSALCKNQNAFLDALQSVAEKLYNREYDILSVEFGDLPNAKEYSARIAYDQIIKIEQYNPKVWNNFLNVIPPENVPLRLEVRQAINRDHFTDYKVSRFCAIWNGQWFYVSSIEAPAILIDQEDLAKGALTVTFKAWDD